MNLETQLVLFNNVLIEYEVPIIESLEVLKEFDIDENSTELFIEDMAKLHAEQYQDAIVMHRYEQQEEDDFNEENEAFYRELYD